MGHVQQFNDRQYFSKELTGNEVSQGIAQVGNTFTNTLNTAVSVTQKANQSTLANNQIDLSTKFLAKNNEINTKYQADPTNPQREVEIQEAFNSLASQYKVNPLCDVQWNEIKSDVFNRYKTYNAQWVEKQQVENTQINFKNGYETLLNQVSMLGDKGSSIDEMKLIYANGIEGLKKSATANLGEVYVNDFLKDSNHDIMSTYISALAVKNPLQAQELLKREDVRNDLGNAETIEKLESYVATSLLNQSKRTAVDELGNTLRSMNSDEAKNILNGKANLNQVMKFVESNKNLPEGTKDLVLDIYGIGSRTDYYYDRDKKKIIKAPEGGSRGRSGNSLTAIKNMSKMQKEDLAFNLEQGVIDMFSFSDTKPVNPKNAVNKGQSIMFQSETFNRLKSVAEIQGAIDTAYSSKVITKDKRQSLMDKYIQPMTNYLQANLEGLDERQHFMGSKLGYGRLKEMFSVEGIPERNKNQIKQRNKMLLTAQSAYYSSLDGTRSRMGLSSIYDLENLPTEQQKAIYKQASDYAIDCAKKYGEHPEYFFKQEYPQLYAQGVKAFGIDGANEVAKKVAKEIYNVPEGSKVDVKKTMSNAIIDMYALKEDKALKSKIALYEKTFVAERPKLSHSEIYGTHKPKDYDKKMKAYNQQMQSRMKALNLSEDDVKTTAKIYKITESEVLSMLELQKIKQRTGKDITSIRY